MQAKNVEDEWGATDLWRPSQIQVTELTVGLDCGCKFVHPSPFLSGLISKIHSHPEGKLRQVLPRLTTQENRMPVLLSELMAAAVQVPGGGNGL